MIAVWDCDVDVLSVERISCLHQTFLASLSSPRQTQLFLSLSSDSISQIIQSLHIPAPHTQPEEYVNTYQTCRPLGLIEYFSPNLIHFTKNGPKIKLIVGICKISTLGMTVSPISPIWFILYPGNTNTQNGTKTVRQSDMLVSAPRYFH